MSKLAKVDVILWGVSLIALILCAAVGIIEIVTGIETFLIDFFGIISALSALVPIIRIYILVAVSSLRERLSPRKK